MWAQICVEEECLKKQHRKYADQWQEIAAHCIVVTHEHRADVVVLQKGRDLIENFLGPGAAAEHCGDVSDAVNCAPEQLNTLKRQADLLRGDGSNGSAAAMAYKRKRKQGLWARCECAACLDERHPPTRMSKRQRGSSVQPHATA